VRLSNPFGPGQDIKGQLGAASIFAARALAGQRIEIWGDGERRFKTVLRNVLPSAGLAA